MKGTSYMCKANNAVNVKIILSGRRPKTSGCREVISVTIIFTSLILLWVAVKRKVDTQILLYIIIFTQATLLDRENLNGEAIAQRSQTRQSAATRNPQLPSPDRDRRVVPAGRVLRCARLSASEIRDASSGAEGRPSGFHNRRRVWLLSSFVLPSSVRVRASWFGWADTTQARSEGGSQNHRGDRRVPATSTPAECFPADRATSGSGQAEIPKAGSSTNHRAGSGAQSKKTAPAETMTIVSTICHQELTAHYEQLRDDALSLTTGRQPTPGLALLLRQGTAAWMQAWSACAQKPAVEAMTSSASSQTNSLDARVQMASILAGIILDRPLEAAHESGCSSESHSRTSQTQRLSLCSAIGDPTGLREYREYQTSVGSPATCHRFGLGSGADRGHR